MSRAACPPACSCASDEGRAPSVTSDTSLMRPIKYEHCTLRPREIFWREILHTSPREIFCRMCSSNEVRGFPLERRGGLPGRPIWSIAAAGRQKTSAPTGTPLDVFLCRRRANDLVRRVGPEQALQHMVRNAQMDGLLLHVRTSERMPFGRARMHRSLLVAGVRVLAPSPCSA